LILPKILSLGSSIHFPSCIWNYSGFVFYKAVKFYRWFHLHKGFPNLGFVLHRNLELWRKEEIGKSKSHDNLTTVDQLYVQLNTGVDRLILNQSKQSNKELWYLWSVRKAATNESLLPCTPRGTNDVQVWGNRQERLWKRWAVENLLLYLIRVLLLHWKWIMNTKLKWVKARVVIHHVKHTGRYKMYWFQFQDYKHESSEKI